MYKEGIVFMDYRTILQEENDVVRERLDLSMERVTAMGEEDIRQPYGNYFRCVSRFVLMIGELVKERKEGSFFSPNYRSEITGFTKIFCRNIMKKALQIRTMR